jgi:hypothetical protein
MLRLLRSALGESAAGLAVALPSSMPDEREGLPLLTDSVGELATAYFAQPGMAWRVRPDGYVGWCSDAPSVIGLHTALETITQMSPLPGQV